MEGTQTPKYGNHGNLIRSLKTKTLDDSDLTITIECSDIISSQYQGYSEKLKSVKVDEITIMRKELDQPLSFVKSLLAKIASIKEEHQFLLLQTEAFLASIDFYQKNRLVIRLGDRHFVMDEQRSLARKNSQIRRQQNGLLWRRTVKKQEEVTFGDIMGYIFGMGIKDFSQVSNNGSHLSQQLFNIIQDVLIRPA